MCPAVEASEIGQSNEDRFSTYLSELKERGSTLLIVGRPPSDCYSPFCDAMLGDPTSGPRCQVRVTTDGDIESPQVQSDPSATHAPIRHVVSTFGERSTATASAVAAESTTVTHVDGTSLSKLGIAISKEIEELETQRAGFESAELRVCFDSIQPLIEEYDEQQVFRFLHILTGRIRSTSGMGHFHLQLQPDDELVTTFAELFDAVIELATRDDQLVQRWRIQDQNLRSDWMPV